MGYREKELEKAIWNCVNRMGLDALIQYVIEDMLAYYADADSEAVDQMIENYGNGES